MAKKSILYIITKSVWGGAGKYVYDLATNLSGDFDVAVAAGGKERLAEQLIEANIPYFEIKHFQRDINLLKEPLAGLEILSLLIKLKPDIVHVNSSKAGGMVGLMAKIYQIISRRKIKMVFTAHGWAFAEDRPKTALALINLLSKITALFYDTIICVSEYDKLIAIRNNIAPVDKLIVIHNGIDIENLKFLSRQEAQEKLTAGEYPFVIGTIAEWHSNKGLFYLLDAVNKMDLPAKTAIVLIGSGENRDKEKLYQYLENNKSENIHLHEFIPNAASYLKALDIFVLPSVKEGLPYTILEAMLARVPVVGTAVGGVPEVIENDISGFLVQPKNSQQLAQKINYPIGRPQETEAIVRNAYQKVTQEFSLENMVSRTREIY